MAESSLARTISARTRLIGASIILAITLTGCVGLMRSTEDNNDILAQSAEVINSKCPMTVDAETRLDNAVAMSGKVLAYRYTLVNYAQRDLSEKDVKTMQESLTPQLRNVISSSSDMKGLRDYGTTFKYIYSSNDGFELMTITVTPDDYS